MPRVIAMIQVEDAEKWEKGFRTHGALFKSQTVTNCHYSTNNGNDIALCFDVDDVDTYLRILESPETAEAMACDGVNQETVRVFVLDKQYAP